MTCYTDFYPFQTLAEKELSQLDFSHITIFYGGNGSGKTTAINGATALIIEAASLKTIPQCVNMSLTPLCPKTAG